MPKIKLLSDKTINRIAAGEVIERPMSVIKELVENSLDAGAKNIEVEIERGGRNLISISDDGCGIEKEQLDIATERHATSKLNEDDINDIQHLGFRGEALPSIAAVSKMRIISKTKDSKDAWEVNISGGEKESVKPAARDFGTTIEVRDIFCFTPSRLKFLKSERSEISASIDLIQRFALSFQDASFKLISDGKTVLDIKAGQVDESERLASIISQDFVDNCIEFDNEIEGLRIWGYAGLPTYNRNSSLQQYVYVNKRSVKDKFFMGSLKGAYQNLIPDGRYPAAVIFIEVDPYAVDVNVHPTKAEVRFRDSSQVRQFLISSIRNAVKSAGIQASTTVAEVAIDRMAERKQVANAPEMAYEPPKYDRKVYDMAREIQAPNPAFSESRMSFNKGAQKSFDKTLNESSKDDFNYPKDAMHFRFDEPKQEEQQEEQNDFPLGMAKCQIGRTYIISETKNGFIIIDQHAAHERLVLERMKAQLEEGSLNRQLMLVPEVIELGQLLCEKVLEHSDELKKFGIVLEKNGNTQVLVREIPEIFGKLDVKEFIKDIAEDVAEYSSSDTITEKRDLILGNMACHSSIRAGRKLNIDEMNAILREMEQTPFAGQCNHGRPTHTEFKLEDLEKIFERI